MTENDILLGYKFTFRPKFTAQQDVFFNYKFVCSLHNIVVANYCTLYPTPPSGYKGR